MLLILIAIAVITVLAAVAMTFLDAIARGFGGSVDRPAFRDIAGPALIIGILGGLVVGGLWELIEAVAGWLA